MEDYSEFKKTICAKWSFNGTDERIEFFNSQFDQWIRQLPDSIVPTILSLLERFDYYTLEETNNSLKELHQRMESDTEIDFDTTMFTYLKKSDARVCSSLQYWHEYTLMNDIKTTSLVDDIDKLDPVSWDLIKNVVIVDDCCGTGSSLISYVNEYKDFFRGKTIYYIVIHCLVGAIPKFEDLEKLNNTKVKIICKNHRTNAFSEHIWGDKTEYIKKQFCKASNDLGIVGKDNVWGYKKAQGLMAFHNNTPNDTLGLFWKDTDHYKSIFPRNDPEKPNWRKMAEEQRKRHKENYAHKKSKGSL